MDGQCAVILKRSALLWKARSTQGYHLSKRAFDILASAVISVILLPIIAFLIVLVMLDGGPAFYAQRRVGRGGVIFKCWKFRTMVEDADAQLETILRHRPDLRIEFEKYWKLENDPRVTWIGKFLRRYSLDELPQVFNVLIGDMSLVGPRPRSVKEMQYFDATLPESSISYLRLKPGITGWWQINGRNKLSLSDKAKLDAEYAERCSITMDLFILVATLPVVISGDGAS
jgi:exopolysaccharide production protein ExoY